MVDRLIDEPNWWSHFTHPPRRRVSEFRPSSSSSSSSNHSSSSDSNNSVRGEFCCFVDDIHILSNQDNHKAFVIIDGKPELETCSLSEDLVDRLVKLGLSQKSQSSKKQTVTKQNNGPVSCKDRTQFRKDSFKLGFPKTKQRSKKRLEKKEKPPHLRYYLEYLNRMIVANLSLSKYIKVVVFLANSLLKRLHLQLVKYDFDDVSNLSDLLTFRVTPLYGNTLFLSTTQSTTTTTELGGKCSFDTKVLLKQCKDRSSYDSKLH